MKTIGLIGGMTYLSTLKYYEIINKRVSEKLGGFHSASCLLVSPDFAEIERLQEEGGWERLARLMTDFALTLERGGADFVIICSNTMHRVAGEMERNITIPLLHIADATAEKIKEKGLTKAGLIGTDFTMQQDFYKKRLWEKHGIETLIPSEEDRKIVCDVIYNELTFGIINPRSRRQYGDIIGRLISEGAGGVILGCTEIPLLINQADVKIPLFDTTSIHSSAAAELALI